eukprot:TRINITY_DN21224_c0_g1_i1.p1 TRINITY_DN21224_c0_g1~~TRINITY_DN21224_c0_g1_i1.p1  ORF type:complete len:120 (+),score=5.65 TRINITY_DN21224_c0_g1_i1:176-535(+)
MTLQDSGKATTKNFKKIAQPFEAILWLQMCVLAPKGEKKGKKIITGIGPQQNPPNWRIILHHSFLDGCVKRRISFHSSWHHDVSSLRHGILFLCRSFNSPLFTIVFLITAIRPLPQKVP